MTTTTTQTNVKALLEELIERESGLSTENDPENFAIARDYALNKFRTHKFARTNQFDIVSRLQGLEEKFRIRDGEALADALQVRIEELKGVTDITGPNNSTPEVLHLLLELSDEPLNKTRLSDLDALVPPSPPKELTWEDIIAEDPLEGEIWDDVDFGAESSDAWSGDDEVLVQYLPIRERLRKASQEPLLNTKRRKRKKAGESTPEEDEEEGYRVVGVEGSVLEGDNEGLEVLKGAQYWARKVAAKEEEIDVALGGTAELKDVWIVSELQVLREVIFMLLGHACTLFEKGREGDESAVWINTDNAAQRFGLRHASLQGFVAILEWFAEKGTNLNRIRAFARQKEELPEHQSFIAAVDDKIAGLDCELINIEEKFVGNGAAQTVSFLALQSQLEPLIRPFTTLCNIIANLSRASHLEQLYQAACELQSTGDIPSYHFIATIFFSCLRTYLRPIRLWMESGILSPVDDFLIIPTAPDADVDLSTFWHSQYRLRFIPSGEPAAPSFIRPVASRILTTGKSVIFLQHLLPSVTTPETPNLTETEITFSDVIFPGADLAPFSSLFEAAFNHWISTRHRNISVRLRQQLFNCGLFRSLDALEHVFFANNGYLFSVLTSSIFAKLDRKAAAWRDRFLLTDLIQSVFSTVASIDAGNLRMGVATAAEPGVVSSRSWKDRVGKKNIHSLEALAIEYRLPWAVANILTPATSYPVYNTVFTFLLQLRRVRYLLERLPLRPPKDDHHGQPPPKCYYKLKQTLLWFCNTVTAYVTDVVLAPQCAKLRTVLAHCVDVDALCAAHEAFLSTVIEQCLLGEKLAPIHRAVMGVLDSAVKFTRLCAVPEEEAEGGWKKRKRRRRRKGDDGDDDDEEDDDSSDDNMEVPESPSSASSANSSLISQLDDGAEEMDDEEERYARRLERMRGAVEGSVGFIRTGLRGVSRAGVMPHLEMLAERLEGYGMG